MKHKTSNNSMEAGTVPGSIYKEGAAMTSNAFVACQQSVVVDVPVSFAWTFMTDVRNWSDPPAEFSLDGPFAGGTRGATRMPGQPDRSWTVQEVTPGRAYTLHTSLGEHAYVLFHWRFDPVSEHRTTLTQRIEVGGEHAEANVNDIRSAFEPSLEPGMQRIARMMMTRAARER
jgi:polyketide cyclase/dehydrase/lipid transport protein